MYISFRVEHKDSVKSFDTFFECSGFFYLFAFYIKKVTRSCGQKLEMILSLNWFLEAFATHLGKIPSVYHWSPFGFEIQIFYKSLQNRIAKHFLLQTKEL